MNSGWLRELMHCPGLVDNPLPYHVQALGRVPRVRAVAPWYTLLRHYSFQTLRSYSIRYGLFGLVRERVAMVTCALERLGVSREFIVRVF